MRLGIVGDWVYSQGLPCFCGALLELWCVIYSNLFGFQTKYLGEAVNKVDFFPRWFLSRVDLSQTAQRHKLSCRSCLCICSWAERSFVCQLFGQPCCAGPRRGFCAHQQLPQHDVGSWETIHFVLIWICCILVKERFFLRFKAMSSIPSYLCGFSL